MTGPPDDDALALAQTVFGLAREGDAAQLAAYLDAGVPVNLTNDKGDTLLLLAAYHDNLPAVRALLDRDADTARVNDRGQTAIAAAAFRRSRNGVRMLLEAGADPALGSPSAIEVARFFDLPEVLGWLQGD